MGWTGRASGASSSVGGAVTTTGVHARPSVVVLLGPAVLSGAAVVGGVPESVVVSVFGAGVVDPRVMRSSSQITAAGGGGEREGA